MIEMTIRRVGNSLGVILPAEALRALGAREGEKLFLTQCDGGHRITRYDPDFAEQMEAAEECLHDFGDALRELGK